MQQNLINNMKQKKWYVLNGMLIYIARIFKVEGVKYCDIWNEKVECKKNVKLEDLKKEGWAICKQQPFLGIENVSAYILEIYRKNENAFIANFLCKIYCNTYEKML